MMNIENVLKAYETDANAPQALGRFEVLNMLTNRDVLEELKGGLTTRQAARLLFADEKLAANSAQVIVECGGVMEFINLRQHNPAPSAWWFLEQLPVEQLTLQDLQGAQHLQTIVTLLSFYFIAESYHLSYGWVAQTFCLQSGRLRYVFLAISEALRRIASTA